GPYHFLAVICLLCFFQDMLSLVYPRPEAHLYVAGRVLSLLLFVFSFLLFRSNLGGRLRYSLNLLLSALVSSLCTYWTLKGWGEASLVIDLLLSGVLILLLAISLRKIFRNDELGVFRHPLFWIEGGTLFYLLLFLLLEGMGKSGQAAAFAPDPEKRLFLGLASLVRYCSYLVALFSL
ncbi:MAG TPA: hypothetical protein VGM89_04840, partial [Puia sp.]